MRIRNISLNGIDLKIEILMDNVDSIGSGLEPVTAISGRVRINDGNYHKVQEEYDTNSTKAIRRFYNNIYMQVI